MGLKKKASQQGFTLAEALVTILLVTVCFGVIVNLFIGQNRIYKVQTAELMVTSDARTALDDIDNYVRQSYRAVSNYSTYTASSQVLILQIRSINSGNQLLSGAYDYVVYYLDGTNFYRQIFPNALSSRTSDLKRLANNINSLNFTYNDVSFPLVTEITTNLTAQLNTGTNTQAITVSTISSLRNY
ncbi:MAG: hypothetical protein KW804_01125 [Candidatus Doudnabacteria bacterium]|nr:hypothetical protein [Candidatus Doudnabacteria bacterium]